ncbi:MAG: thioesterase family protein [Prevotellaceae bacterium]|nr:thioesterase family protein [Prevotellaceae bacterium]
MDTYKHKVKYYECDGMAVTHHSNYVRIMEEARIDLLDRLGYGYEKMEKDGILSPVVEVKCQYLHPTKFQDTIETEVTVKSMSQLKLTFAYTMRVGETVVCKAESTHCFMENNRPINISQRYPELAVKLSECK